MIENSPDSRPQSAVSQAGIVFEAVAEGGITRYLTLFQETRPGVIGPVRSLRIYYLDWAMGFEAGVAHVGGSADALQLVRDRGARDLDQFNHHDVTYRVGDRAAPHNAYTDFDRLDKVSNQLGYTGSNFTPYGRKKDTPANPVTHPSIAVSYSGPQYAAEFRYEAANNRYLRFNAGQPDIDRASNEQITVKNLVVISMPTSYSGKYPVMPTIGSGNATLYRDGTAVAITWNKPDPRAQLRLIDQSGKDVELNRGNTWFAIVPAG